MAKVDILRGVADFKTHVWVGVACRSGNLRFYERLVIRDADEAWRFGAIRGVEERVSKS